MFSYERRLKAVKLLLQYDMSYSTVIQELGYHSKESLRNWYYEYRKEGELHRDFARMHNGNAQRGCTTCTTGTGCAPR